MTVGSVLTSVGLQLGLLWNAPRRSKGSSASQSSSGGTDNSTVLPMAWNACGNMDVQSNRTLFQSSSFSLGPKSNGVTTPTSSVTFVPSAEPGNPVQVAMLEVLQSRISSWRGSTVTLSLPSMSTAFKEYTSKTPVLTFPACNWTVTASWNYVYTPRVFSPQEMIQYGMNPTTFIPGEVTDVSAPSAIAASWGASQLKRVGQSSADWKIGNLRKLADVSALSADSEPLPVLAFYKSSDTLGTADTVRVGSLVSNNGAYVTIRFGHNIPEIVPTTQLLDLYAVDPHPDNSSTPVGDTPTPVDNTGYVIALWVVVLACMALYIWQGKFFRRTTKTPTSDVEMAPLAPSPNGADVASQNHERQPNLPRSGSIPRRRPGMRELHQLVSS